MKSVLQLLAPAALLVTFGLVACSSEPAREPSPQSTAPCAGPRSAGQPFGVQCGQLVDEQGRVTFLRGINARIDGVFDVSFDDGRVALETVPKFTAEDAAQLRDFGFDSLRLPINWSAIEPTEDGGINQAYLERVEAVVDLCAAQGISVLLDLHQDAYSKEIGEDGAPLWAIEPAPEMLLEGPLEDLQERRLSKQVGEAFTTFFGDTQAGRELRERFVSMAEQVMQRFAGHPAVIGLEIFNEPQAGDDGIARLNNAAYSRIRAASPNKLYVYEPPVVRNFTDQSTLASGPLGEMVGYAPHVYTFAFTATDAQKAAMEKEKLRRSNANARAEADALSAPLIITEWGFDPNGIKGHEYLTWQSELQEEYMASSYFWLWKEQSQGRWGCFDYDDTTGAFSPRQTAQLSLARVRPSRVAGWPIRYAFDRSTGIFELDFRGDPTVKAPHVIAVAPALGAPLAMTCDGAPVEATAGLRGEYSVSCGARSDQPHTLRVEVTPRP